MIRVGIDSGTTLTKFCWLDMETGKYRFRTEEDKVGILNAVLQVERLGAESANLLGIGSRPGLDSLKLIRKEGDPIDNELRIQGDGARRVLALSGQNFSDKSFFLVSIGTGTSYVIVHPDGIDKLPLGSMLGGGFISGLAALTLPVSWSFEELNAAAAEGVPADIFVRDLVKPEEIDPNDPNLIVSNFGRADRLYTSKNAIAATIFHCVAANIVRDVLLMNKGCKQVVFIGTPVSASTVLTQYLSEYSRLLKLEPVFPSAEYAAYAGAMGALHMND
ncbi:MAG: hypothetical protein AAB389_00900 [Patescibacteria group bacterium]|mgnify:FL=1